MFGGSEVSGGNLTAHDKVMAVGLVRQFIDILRSAVEQRRIAQGTVPFLRPANGLLIWDAASIHAIIENDAVVGMPSHKYIDERPSGKTWTVQALIEQVRRDLGYKDPWGISLSADLAPIPPEQRVLQLTTTALQMVELVARDQTVRQLGIPAGYQHLVRHLPAFLDDHPDANNNVFLMMRFKEGVHYQAIQDSVRKSCEKHGLHVIRADDRDYTGDLWDNVCLCMLGCRYGITVFEEIDAREFNPSVAMELGFMMATNRRCLILKDKRMPMLPTDIVGKLYKEFDTYQIPETIDLKIASWVDDLGRK